MKLTFVRWEQKNRSFLPDLFSVWTHISIYTVTHILPSAYANVVWLVALCRWGMRSPSSSCWCGWRKQCHRVRRLSWRPRITSTSVAGEGTQKYKKYYFVLYFYIFKDIYLLLLFPQLIFLQKTERQQRPELWDHLCKWTQRCTRPLQVRFIHVLFSCFKGLFTYIIMMPTIGESINNQQIMASVKQQ